MAIFRLNWNEPAPEPCRDGAVAIGNFDGVHLGHQTLLASLKASAQAIRGPAVAITFDPHPLSILRPELFQPTLTTLAERARLLASYGADHVIALQVQAGLLHLSANSFFDEVLRKGLDARRVVEGPNFRFGHNREGNVDLLAGLCAKAGMDLAIVDPLMLDGVVVSSSKVRQALLDGDLATATRFLNRPYRLEGTAVTGQRRGQQLGFPTANLSKIETLIPKDGVYAVRATPHHQPLSPEGRGAMSWPAAANIGPNPTFGEDVRKVEVHLIGYAGVELYGQQVTVDFLARLRDTQRFESVEQLRAQLQQDVASARALAT
jgi:riboflavin kinase/FMN adenylyltransferase